MHTIRVDKWLWSVRIFKSRSLAAKHCREGKVKLNDKKIKSSYQIKVGDVLKVNRMGFDMIYKINQLIDKRVSAPLAKPCYEDMTPKEELNKYESWFIGKGQSERRERGSGRPTKKERRTIDIFKESYLAEEE